MEQKKIDRINALSRKAKLEGLTEAEQEERRILRQEYVRAVVGNLETELSRVVIVDEKTGARRKLRKKGEE